MVKKSLRDKLRGLEVSLIGNRVTTLGFGLIVSSWGLCHAALEAENFYRVCPDPSNLEQNLWATSSILSFVAGFLSVGITTFGKGTRKVYERTKEHIKDFGYLDKRFADNMLGDEKNKPFLGYCQLQGMYLASREMGILDQFKELRKNYSQKIPNF